MRGIKNKFCGYFIYMWKNIPNSLNIFIICINIVKANNKILKYIIYKGVNIDVI